MVLLMRLWLIIGQKVEADECLIQSFVVFYSIGGSGAIDLAHAVEKACLQKPDFKFLYDLRVTISHHLFS
jgi:formyltetrahydrofolate synthetase